MSLKIQRRGKIWHYSGTVAGRRLRGTTGSSDKAIAQRIASEKEQSAWNRRFDGKGAGLTMAQAFIAYLKSEKSARFIDRLAAYWRDTLVADITAGAIRQAAINLYPKAGPATRNRQAIVPTQAAINHCAELDWCKPIKVKRFPIETKPKKFATDAWVTAFQDNSSAHLGALCRFMFETGARIGEAVSLTWHDVDLDKRKARIHQTKINDQRDARITPKVLAALANIPSNRCPADPVFQYSNRENVRKVWDAAIERAGIEKLSPHCCRHGFATAMLRKGVDVKTVARWGGWKDVRVLLETYAHANDDPSIVDEVFGTELTQTDNSKLVNHWKERNIS